MWYAQGPGPWGHVKDFKLSRQPVSFWGMQYEYEIKEWIHDLVSAVSPFRNVNPISSIKMWSRLVKNLDSTSQSKSHFGWETTHCGPNGAKAVGTFSFHAPDLCGPRWPADGSHRHPSRHQCCGQTLQNHGQDTKDYDYWIWYCKGDSCQISPLTFTICWGQPHQFFEKILQSVYSAMSSNMFGAWWAFTTASNLLLTNKPTLNE